MKKSSFLHGSLIAGAILALPFPSRPPENLTQFSTENIRLEKIVPDDGKASLAGQYLAGRFAQHQQDWENAQYYINKVLAQDSGNDSLAQRAFLLSLGAGKNDDAKRLALQFASENKDAGELALIFLSCDAIKNHDYKQAMDYIARMPDSGFGQYTKPLLTVWSLAGQNKFDEARNILAENSQQSDTVYSIHAGLLEELAGNDDQATLHYKKAMSQGLELHSAIIIANFFNRTGKAEISKEIYANLNKIYSYKPFGRHMDKTPVINITDPAQGAAMAMFDLTSILYNNRAYDSAKIYGSLVRMLDRSSDFTTIMMGDIAAVYSRHDEALATYQTIERKSPVFWLAQTRISEVYEMNGDISKSVQVMSEMAKDITIRTEVMASLGDLYRRNNDFVSAIKAYDSALSNIRQPSEEYWSIFYARGIAKERVENWDNAEKDLLTALELQPQNPHILNFIAYSWAEKGINLNQALVYASQAARLKPYDGAIIDSYGWIQFRLGQYDAAVQTLENAVELSPEDAIVLDHLGDAYWKSGHHSEARQQWHKAASLSKDVKFKDIAMQKIENGIITPDELQSQHAQLEK